MCWPLGSHPFFFQFLQDSERPATQRRNYSKRSANVRLTTRQSTSQQVSPSVMRRQSLLREDPARATVYKPAGSHCLVCLLAGDAREQRSGLLVRFVGGPLLISRVVILESLCALCAACFKRVCAGCWEVAELTVVGTRNERSGAFCSKPPPTRGRLTLFCAHPRAISLT